MRKADVLTQMYRVREAQSLWRAGYRDAQKALDKITGRLLLEAARNFISIDEAAGSLGLTPKRVRSRLRLLGVKPGWDSLMSKQAARALTENAELMGIEPAKMDLLSPLAYLPMGSELREFLETKGKTMQELSGTDLAEGWWCQKCEFFEDDDQIDTTVDECPSCGCPGATHLRVAVVAK